MEIFIGICIGIGLSAASGFRIFVPLFILSLATKVGYFTPSANFEWLGSNASIIAFGVATLVEILGYYIPVVDNFLDTIATPIAVIAGIIVMASALGELNPFLRWALAIIAGGGIAGTVQILTTATRAASTSFTAGIANPFFASIEAIASFAISILAILVPIIAFILIILVICFIIKKFVRSSRYKT